MKTKDLYQALVYLSACIDEGLEYPDAHWATIAHFNLTVKQGEILTDMYDRHDECYGGYE